MNVQNHFGIGKIGAFLKSSLLLALLFIFVQGCVRPPNDRTPDGRVIVQYWEKWTGFEGDAMQAVVDDFNASQTNIFVDKLTVSQIDRKLMLSTAGGNPPDVAGLWSFNIFVYSEKNALMPLDSMLAEAGITRDHYIPVFWDLCKHHGFMWGLPSTPATLALHWNKKMFREAGLDPDRPPLSIAELDAMAEKLTIVNVVRNGNRVRVRFSDLTPEEKKDKNFDILQMGFSPNEPGWWNPMWGYWFGGDLWDGDRKITANSPQNCEAMRWFQNYPKKYGLENMRTFGSSFGNFSSPQNPFISGQVAMVLQGVWMYNFIDKFAPNMEWAVAPFPSVDPEKYPDVTIAESDVLVIPRGARHPKEAFEFIKFVNSQAPMEKLCLGQRKFSPLAVMSDDFAQKHPNPYIKTFIRLAKSPQAKTTPRMSVWNILSDELIVACGQLSELLKTPEEALDQVQKRTQWKMDRVMRRWDMVEEERIKEWSK
ncbi:MAG: ABC transporter substrate-binding protein [Lentisphaerota bacterium]